MCRRLITGYSGRIYKKYDGNVFELLYETVEEAISEAGKELKDIDGLVTTYLPGIFDGKAHLHFFTSQIMQYIGIKAKYIDLLDFGGASALAMIYRAFKSVNSGQAENVLCVIGGKGSEVRSKGVAVDSYDRLDKGVTITPFDEYFRVYEDMNPVSDYALVAQRHSAVFGTSDRQRAALAVKQRKNAKGNIKAMYRDDMNIEDVLNSPIICDPLHLYEAVYPVDGFHAFVVSRNGSSSSLREVQVIAYGEGHSNLLPCEMDDIVTTPAKESSFAAGFDPKGADCLQLYDSFTITVMLQIEDIGVVEKGRVGGFVENTDISPQGDLPLNTGGGSLNVGQPAYMSGGVLLEEALDQLNDRASGHQVHGAEKVYINAIGGWNRGHSVTLVIGEKD